ncbi:hypothetical protein [Mesorhizobium sp. URHB0026]
MPKDESSRLKVVKNNPHASEAGKFSFLGIEIGGWGSLLALIISLFGVLWTGYDKLIAQPQPELFKPDTIELVCEFDEKCLASSRFFLRANPIVVLNKARGDHAFNVVSISVELSFVDSMSNKVKDVALKWQYISEITISTNKRTPVGAFEVAFDRPFVKEVEFFGRRIIKSDYSVDRANLLDFSQLRELIGKIPRGNLTIEFTAELSGGQILTAGCRVPVDEELSRNIDDETIGVFPRECSV